MQKSIAAGGIRTIDHWNMQKPTNPLRNAAQWRSGFFGKFRPPWGAKSNDLSVKK